MKIEITLTEALIHAQNEGWIKPPTQDSYFNLDEARQIFDGECWVARKKAFIKDYPVLWISMERLQEIVSGEDYRCYQS